MASSCFDDDECVTSPLRTKPAVSKTRWSVAATARILSVVAQAMFGSQTYSVPAATHALGLKAEIFVGFQEQREDICRKEAEIAAAPAKAISRNKKK